MTARGQGFPQAMAAEMRRKAETASDAERDYFTWLAAEWDRTAEREGLNGVGRPRTAPELARA